MNAQAAVSVIGNDGETHEVAPLAVDTKRISNFVEAYRKEYFEQHSLDWCLDTIIERGIAEIKRTVKTQQKTAENKVAGNLLKELGMTPAQARVKLLAALAEQRIAAVK